MGELFLMAFFSPISGSFIFAPLSSVTCLRRQSELLVLADYSQKIETEVVQ